MVSMVNTNSVWLHPAALSIDVFYANYNSKLAPPGDDKRFYSHDVSVMSRWHDDDRIIAVQPMVICCYCEEQVSVAPKDVCRLSIFFFLQSYPLVLAVNKSLAVFCLARSKEKRKWRVCEKRKPLLASLMACFLRVISCRKRLLWCAFNLSSKQRFLEFVLNLKSRP